MNCTRNTFRNKATHILHLIKYKVCVAFSNKMYLLCQKIYNMIIRIIKKRGTK